MTNSGQSRTKKISRTNTIKTGARSVKNRKNVKKLHKIANSRHLNKRVFNLKMVLMRLLFVLLALCLGFVLAHTNWFKQIVHSKDGTTVRSKTTLLQSVNPPVITGPIQTNTLFSAVPTWSQNFADPSYKTLDPNYWQIVVGPAENSNKEAQYYSDSSRNLHIANGALQLVATKDSQYKGYSYSSARIETADKKSFLYGRMDVVAKVPKGVGTWPAIWMLPANDTYANLSPASDMYRYRNGGEVDIMEAVGHIPNTVFGVAHTLNDQTQRSDGTGSYNQITVPNNDTTYSLYSVLWTPDSMTFCVNNTPYFTYNRRDKADYKTWPFDQPFYLIINLAMGGTWGGQDTQHFPGNGIDDSALPASLDIQSIYYYPYTGKITN